MFLLNIFMFILLTFTMAILQPFKTFLSFSAAFNAPQFPFQYIHFLAPFPDCLQNPKETVDFGAAALLCFFYSIHNNDNAHYSDSPSLAFFCFNANKCANSLCP
ncbi:unnamed protein product [Meloidogyne enterolobii]|uniref:Uncharacterized protein n=1 Tax=Meloidogyne enterolobii TaxID=390850 RepID=A0ACB0YSR1_MELEN